MSDDQVFAATARVMQRLGPGQITLAEIAGEAGVTAGALVQRFGSKRNLLLAFTERFAAGAGGLWAGVRSQSRTPLAAIYAYGECMAQMGESAGGLAHHLAYLQLDFSDADFQRNAKAQAVATQKVIEGWIAEAMAEGELRAGVDVEALALAIQAMVGGSLISWGFHQEGRPQQWIRRDLEVLLAPYLRQR